MFSVLMTVYKNDDPKYFEEAFRSIYHDQITKPDEIVLVCDGPLTTALDSKVRVFENSVGCLRLIRLEENMGQGKALNIGLEACSYELVARMDSDDLSTPDRFSDQIGFLTSHPEVDVISSTIREFNETGYTGYRELPTNNEQIYHTLKLRAPVNHGCCVYKRSVVLSVGGYSGLYQCQDYLLWIYLAAKGVKFHNLSQCHMKVRMDDYSRKIGLDYAKEELFLQRKMRSFGLINVLEFIRNIIFKVGGRLMPEKLVRYVYNNFFRK